MRNTISRSLVLPDGRRIAWCERGAAHGSPVFVFHGLPGSRLQFHPDESIARDLQARVIHLERPGFGVSSALHGRTLSDWPRDVEAVANQLGLERFAVIGISGGGPYACACATMLGERVTRAAIVSSVAPPGTMTGSMTWTARLGFALAPRAHWLVWLIMAAARPLIVRYPQRLIDAISSQMSAADRRILAGPALRAVLCADARESFKQGARAFVDDLRVSASRWPLDFAAVRCATRLWHGGDDRLIPVSATHALAKRFPRSEATVLEGEGHFMVFDRWREILGWTVGMPPLCSMT